MRVMVHRLGPVLPASLVVFSALSGSAQSSIEKSAAAILDAKCLSCHGAARMSDLDLRDVAAMLKGGKRGPAIVPGHAEKSLLYTAVKRDGALQMPPGKVALTTSEVGVIRDWINAGARQEKGPTAAGPSWWSFRKPIRPPAPAVKDVSWVRNPIDAFILARLEKEGLRPAAPADRRTLARRAYFDLHGLPPTPREVADFVNDPSENAYEKLIDRLLASPRYGERWGRYWLDLVRYADTSGFETDHFYVSAWRYRDYVIESFNNDKPYNTFVQEQIAADELWPGALDLDGTQHLSKEKRDNFYRRIGTSLFTLGAFPIEFTYYGEQYRVEWEADAVDTVGSAFLGLTVACARCHDHKFDPISERDYYHMNALFAGSEERETPLVSLFDIQTYTRQFPLIAQAQNLKQMAGKGKRRKAQQDAQADDGEPAEAPSPLEQDPKHAALLQQLGAAYASLPDRYPTAQVLAHAEVVPETYILSRADFKQKGEKVEPGFLSALTPGPPIDEPKGVLFVPQRRKALALWLTSPDQPLLSRVMVNRIWQGHFGQGIVRTPNDFGRQGDPPTHPELLDWLAVEFADRGWSIKQMHRQIMLSNTYRQAASVPDDSPGLQKDPGNYYLSHMSRRRLDGDAIRDTVLHVAGSLNLKMGGVGVIPPLSKEELQAARMKQLWPAHPDPSEHVRRSIYLQMKRSMTLPVLQIFDAPDSALSCARRETATVAPQALAMMNSEFTQDQAERFAAGLRKQNADSPAAWVESAWQLAFGRSPSPIERSTAEDYVRRNSLPRLCLLIFNMNEFIYVD